MNPAEPSAENLFQALESYLDATQIADIRRALDFASAAHKNQKRKSGEAYIIHPIATTMILAEYHLDPTTLQAALLHDVPEDTTKTITDIEREFGKDVAALVDGVTKLSQVRLKKNWLAALLRKQQVSGNENFEGFDRHVETLRKMFLAMSRDIRVILIKLADRLHNMETLGSLPAEKQLRIAQETLQVYAPLANRLGIGQLKGRLEDLAFPYAFPEEYQWVKKEVSVELAKRSRSIEKVRRVLLKRLAAIGIRAEGHARAKHLYSLWKKLLRHDRNLDKIYDLVAARVVVPTIEDCYRTLGMIHQMWKPLPGRIKDYIATPKPNGYQSLHTTVFALGGTITEIQIRTTAMHQWAEYGIAAHWTYKEGSHLGTLPNQTKLSWVQELAKLEQVLRDPEEWKKGLQLDFFQDRIFVFTPHGDVFDLPTGATPVDFAFNIHSDLGMHCTGAKVNGRLVPLSHSLENGDIVEILLSKKATPKSDWLQFVRTSRARGLIKRTITPTKEVS